jgi:hypothetical protein
VRHREAGECGRQRGEVLDHPGVGEGSSDELEGGRVPGRADLGEQRFGAAHRGARGVDRSGGRLGRLGRPDRQYQCGAAVAAGAVEQGAPLRMIGRHRRA